MAIVTAMVLGLLFQTVNAEGDITVYVLSQRETAGLGDIVKVNVFANNMPGVTKFGPIEVKFDSEKAEFISVDMGPELSRFVYSTTQTKGSVTISAADQVAESDAEDETSENSVFNSTKDVILFSLYLRIDPSATESVPVWIENVGNFVNNKDEKFDVNIGNGAEIKISEGESNDASITFLRLNGVNFTPEFNKNVTQYTASVERAVTDISVSVTPSNLWAAVVINGNQNLQIGENIITIDVTAQDSVSHMHYEIAVTRKESYVPENAEIVDVNGVTYTFVDLPAEFELPEGFAQSIKPVNGYSVPVFTKDGLSSLLLYLFDGTNAPAFYFYNQEMKTVTPYDHERTIIRTSRVLTMSQVVTDEVPAGFYETAFESDGKVFYGYENEEGEFICYLTDETGDSGFYLYDKTDKTFYRYKFVDRTVEVLYNALFYVFFAISIIEAVILVVVIYIVRKIILDKTNPRPRRV